MYNLQPFFTDRVFQIFDKDNSGSISLQEFIDAIHQFAGQSPEDKIKFLFKVYDIDGDGLIQHRELQHVMRACMEENGMQFSEEQVNIILIIFILYVPTMCMGLGIIPLTYRVNFLLLPLVQFEKCFQPIKK